jgi:hypothetical protein
MRLIVLFFPLLPGCGLPLYGLGPDYTLALDAAPASEPPFIEAPDARTGLPDASTPPDAARDTGATVGDTGSADTSAVDTSVLLPDTSAPSSDAGSCVQTLSNIGTADFHISFTLTTTAVGEPMSLVGQDTYCTEGMEWHVDLLQSDIYADTDDGLNAGANIVSVKSGQSVNDGIPHHIIVARTGGQLWLQIDTSPAQTSVTDTTSFGVLPPLAIETSPACASGRQPFVGTLTDLCVTSP